MAFKEGMKKADPVILEPIMKVVVTVPEDYMGDVIGDLNSRRGRIEGMEARAGAQVIHAYVPLAEMLDMLRPCVQDHRVGRILNGNKPF